MKTVLIFGGSSGIGAAIAEKFNRSGYAVAFTYHTSLSSAQSMVERFNSDGGNASYYNCDVSNASQVEKTVAETLKRYRKIDCLVCCAGIALSKTLTDTSEAEYERLMSVNQKGVFNCCRAVCPSMVSQKRGNIIIISSIAGKVGISCESVYSMSKGGLLAFSSALAKELSCSGIRVNSICPGYIDTKMNSHLTPTEKNDLTNKTLLGRAGSCVDVAEAAYFLAESEYITAAEISVDGGLLI